MNFTKRLREMGLCADDSVVIGSGILDALHIRQSGDLDLVVTEAAFERLAQTGQYIKTEKYGRKTLAASDCDIFTYWDVVAGQKGTFDDLCGRSTIVDGVRFISLEFLLAIKREWATDDPPRQKDIDDVDLIEQYLADHRAN